jgi:hypothetical protein
MASKARCKPIKRLPLVDTIPFHMLVLKLVPLLLIVLPALRFN